MSIQQSFNQGLMGTTFLLGQMPQFKQAQETAADVSRFKKEGGVLKKTRTLIDERAGTEAEAAKAVLEKQGQEFLAGFSKSADPRLRSKAAIATSRLMKGDYDKRISDALSKREQADAKIMDKFEMIEMDRKRALDSIHNLRGQLSGRQAKRLIYKINQTHDKQINEQMDEERKALYGTDE